MGLDLFKLQKLTISAFKSVDRDGKPMPTAVFEAMFNPSTYSQTFALVYAGGPNPQREYLREAPSALSLDLVLDGTGVDDMGLFSFTRKSVSDRVDEFLAVTYKYDGAIHEPNYLIVAWGKHLSFPCRLSTVTIKYTAFDRDGDPLRAELAIRLLSDEAAEKEAKARKPASPDLTHVRIVKHGDTLPLLTRAIYGSSARYLDVARFNALDDFRRLTPGQQLLFPPLVALLAQPGGGTASR
jgi:hypothetical protein